MYSMLERWLGGVVLSCENTSESTKVHFFPYKQVRERNGDHEWLRMTNVFILCNLLWKVQKRHAGNSYARKHSDCRASKGSHKVTWEYQICDSIYWGAGLVTRATRTDTGPIDRSGTVRYLWNLTKLHTTVYIFRFYVFKSISQNAFIYLLCSKLM